MNIIWQGRVCSSAENVEKTVMRYHRMTIPLKFNKNKLEFINELWRETWIYSRRRNSTTDNVFVRNSLPTVT